MQELSSSLVRDFFSKNVLSLNILLTLFVSRSLRHVLRLRDIRSVRARKKRHPTGPGFLLPHLVAQWSHLAHRGHALDPPIRVPMPPTDSSDQLTKIYPHERLAYHRPWRLYGLRINPHLDSPFLSSHFNYFEVQKKLGCHQIAQGSVHCIRVIMY